MSSDKIALIPLIRGTDIQVVFNHTEFCLPQKVKKLIEKNWEILSTRNPNFFRGQLFLVSHHEVNRSSIRCVVSQSDYAHYLATLHNCIPREFFCRSLHVSVVVITSDNYLIFGKMGEETSTPWQIQCAGGGVTHEHLFSGSDTHIDIVAAAQEELREEMYFDIESLLQVSSLRPIFFKVGGTVGNIGILFEARTPLLKTEVLRLHTIGSAKEKERGNSPEFCELIPIRNTSEDVKTFLHKNTLPLCEYMPSLMRKIANLEVI